MINFLLQLVTVNTDVEPCRITIAHNFGDVFDFYRPSTNADTRKQAVQKIADFYNNTILSSPANLRVFKVWFQTMINLKSDQNLLVKEIKKVTGLDMTAGIAPSTYCELD
jgi:hypothetical protein